MAQLNTRIVLRNDSTANWLASSTQVLMKGEVGIEFLADGKVKIKIGDGIKTWSELDYFGSDVKGAQIFQVSPTAEQTDAAAIEAAVGEATLQTGDIAICKRAISGEKYEYTAYVYSGSAWAAMDGNYNAENVYFDQDLLTTSAIGNITLTNGQATIAANGKNLKQVFDTIFVKEAQPTANAPAVTVNLSGAGAKEAGTKLVPSFTASLSAGSYTYGPATGITATSWSVTDGRSGVDAVTAASGSFPELQVTDGINYRLTAEATHGAGAMPITNVGNEAPSKQIPAGSKTGYSSYISAYRNSFFGTLTTVPENEVFTSAIIRGLSKSNASWSNGKQFDVAVPVGAKCIVFAYPASLREVSSVKDVNGMSAEIKTAFSSKTVSVAGANDYSPIDYRVYYQALPEAVGTANTYKVTI